MIILDCIQPSPEWHQARLGVLTASRAGQLITAKRLQRSAQASTLANRLIAERLTGESAEEFAGNYWTERGHEYEDAARNAFAWRTGLEARPVGFIYRDEQRATGCSPDWFDVAGQQWGLELKCPSAHTHVGYLRASEMPAEYAPQVQFSLWVTGVPRWYFYSYHPALPECLHEVEPDPRWQDVFDEHVPGLLAEVADVTAALQDDREQHGAMVL